MKKWKCRAGKRPSPRTATFAAAFALAAATASAQPPFTAIPEGAWLAKNGVFNGKIYLPAVPAPAEREAAKTLALWFGKVADAAPEIAPEPPGTDAIAGILVGATRRAAAAGITAPAAGAGETWRWEPRAARALFLLGNTPLATRLAAGDFIQRHLGVAFLLPGEWGAEWTPAGGVRLPRDGFARVPAFAWRGLSGTGGAAAAREWRLNNGLGAMPDFTHGLHGVFDAATAAAHPGFFPVIAGRRHLPSGRGPYEPQPNLAAAGAALHAAGRAAAFFRANPEAPSFMLGITDSQEWDESPATRALAPPGRFFRNLPDYSNCVFMFMNRVATALWPAPAGVRWDTARWRDNAAGAGAIPAVPAAKLLGCIAYGNCQRAPDFPLHPNIMPVLAADRSQWRDTAFARADRELIADWSRSGVRRFGLYDYLYGRDFLIPRIFFEEQTDAARWAEAHGASLFYAELYPDWGFDAPKAWLATRLFLRPSRDSAPLLDYFFQEAYGPAAPAAREFFDIAGECWRRNAGGARWLKFRFSENAGELVSERDQRRMRDALMRAEQAFPAALPGDFHHTGATPARLPPDVTPPPAPPRRDASARAARLLRQQVRLRMTTLAFAVTDRFLDWHRNRAELFRAAPPAEPADALAQWAKLRREPELRRRFMDALAAWNVSDCNPGEPRRWEDFERGNIGATVALRLLRACRGRVRAARAANDAAGAAEWASAGREIAAGAIRLGLRPLLRSRHFSPDAAAPPLWEETFPPEAFAPPPPESWLAALPVALPRAPWRAEVAANATLRLGCAREDNAAGGVSFLRMTGAGAASFARDIPGALNAGDAIVAVAHLRGRVSAGATVALAVQFLDAAGRPLRTGQAALALPAEHSDWRPLACVAEVPAGGAAGGARLVFRCEGQEPDETLDAGNFSVEKAPARTK